MDPEDFEQVTDDPQDAFEESVDELSMDFVVRLTDKVMAFMDVLVGHPLHEYQQPLARRIIDERHPRRRRGDHHTGINQAKYVPLECFSALTRPCTAP